MRDIEAFRRAVDHCGRPIILSIVGGETPVNQASQIKSLANQWRISAELGDSWPHLDRAFDLFDAWHGQAGPGHWLDAGDIPLGHIAIRDLPHGPDRPTRLTRDEQLALLTLWSMSSSPLMLGMNLPDNDDWLRSLLTNDEMLAIDQDPLGQPARRVVKSDGKEVWVKELANNDKALGFFNRSDRPASVVVFWPEAGLTGPCWVRDIWSREDRAEADRGLEIEVEPHGAALLKLHQIPIVNRP
jgi:hypothetical protein